MVTFHIVLLLGAEGLSQDISSRNRCGGVLIACYECASFWLIDYNDCTVVLITTPVDTYSIPQRLSFLCGLEVSLGQPYYRTVTPKVPSAKRRRLVNSDGTLVSAPPGMDSPAYSRVFFQVTGARPPAGKHLHGAPATNTWLESGDIAITMRHAGHDHSKLLCNTKALAWHISMQAGIPELPYAQISRFFSHTEFL